MSIRQKIETTGSTEPNPQQDGNASNQPTKSDQEIFEELNRKYEEKMVQKPSVEENVVNTEQSFTNQQQNDPTETDDDGKTLYICSKYYNLIKFYNVKVKASVAGLGIVYKSIERIFIEIN